MGAAYTDRSSHSFSPTLASEAFGLAEARLEAGPTMAQRRTDKFGLIRNTARSIRATGVSRETPIPDASPDTPEPASLVVVAPYLDLLESLLTRVESGRRFGIDSAEQRLFELFAKELSKATEEARCTDVWMTAAEVATSCDIPAATLNRWCRIHGTGKWARRIGRLWSIHFPGFRSWMKEGGSPRSAA